MAWSSECISDQRGKTFVVTGGNAGIGFATADTLAAKRARVIVGCRSEEKAQEAIVSIRSRHPEADVSALPLDLANLASVRACAERLAVEVPALDGLINNAGVMMTPRERTKDGFEMQFGTNMLGHFALTGLLFPLLARAPAARIVSLSSLGHWFGRIEFDNLSAERDYRPLHAYAQSKLATLIYAYELQRRLQRIGSSILSVAVHPGVTHSGLGRYAWWIQTVLRLYGQSTHEGALPSLMALVDPQVKGGAFIGPGGFLTFKGAPRQQRSSHRSQSAELGAKLWDRAQQMTGVRYL